jgi:integrase
LLALDIETSLTIRNWVSLAGISEGYLLRGITGKQLNLSMDPGQISRTFKSLAIKAKLDPEQISGHSTRIGAAQDMLSGGASIGQIMAKVGWSKVDTVIRYVVVNNIEAMNSPSTLQSEPAVYSRPQNSITI